jgi:hypothetical protein
MVLYPALSKNSPDVSFEADLVFLFNELAGLIYCKGVAE